MLGYCGQISVEELPEELRRGHYFHGVSHVFVSVTQDDWPIDPRIKPGPDLIRKFPAKRLSKHLRGAIPPYGLAFLTIFPEPGNENA